MPRTPTADTGIPVSWINTRAAYKVWRSYPEVQALLAEAPVVKRVKRVHMQDLLDAVAEHDTKLAREAKAAKLAKQAAKLDVAGELNKRKHYTPVVMGNAADNADMTPAQRRETGTVALKEFAGKIARNDRERKTINGTFASKHYELNHEWPQGYHDVMYFLKRDLYDDLKKRREEVQGHLGLGFEFEIEFKKAVTPKLSQATRRVDDDEGHIIAHIRIPSFFFNNSAADFADKLWDHLMLAIREWMGTGSGWVIQKVISLLATSWKINVRRGASFVPLPEVIQNKKAVINVQNSDQKCFLWSVLAGLHPAEKDACRTSKYKAYESSLNMQGIEYPVSIEQIDLFETQNPGVAVSLYSLADDAQVVPERPSPKFGHSGRTHIQLLLHSGHYSLIKDLDRLLNSGAGFSRKHCQRCLRPFDSQELCDVHMNICKKGGRIQEEVMPTAGKDDTLKFMKHKAALHHPFAVYADFESLCMPVEAQDPARATQVIQEQVPCAVGMLLHSTLPEFNGQYYSFTGEPEVVVDQFLKKTQEWAELAYDAMRAHMHLPKVSLTGLTREEEASFQAAKVCWLCEKNLTRDDKDDRVRDHCHLTGKYRGAAHWKCNIDYRIPDFVPVFFHNLKGYDSHIIIRHLGKYIHEAQNPDNVRLSAIPITQEKFMTFSWSFQHSVSKKSVKVNFLDSFNFMGFSLDTLAGDLTDVNCKLLRAFFPSDDAFKLARRKAYMCYDYVDSLERLDETAFPPKSACTSRLTGKACSDEDYERALQAWDAFGCKTCRYRAYRG
jgi:hypothetical protein